MLRFLGQVLPWMALHATIYLCKDIIKCMFDSPPVRKLAMGTGPCTEMQQAQKHMHMWRMRAHGGSTHLLPVGRIPHLGKDVMHMLP